jgi:hypothetical protein
VALTRAEFVSRSAKGGAALLLAGTLVDAAAADPLPASDLAYARLLVGAELLVSDFYRQAVAASNAKRGVLRYLRKAYANEQEHYQSVAGILRGAGLTPAAAGDIDFSYPRGTFGGERSILELALQIENVMLGAYLGAIGGIQTNALKQGLGEITAAEAQHVSYFATANGGKAFWLSFPPPLAIDQASNALDAYSS